MAEALWEEQAALPPKIEESPPPQRKRRYPLQKVICIVCASVTVCTFGLCAFQALEEILAKGVWNAFSEMMLSKPSGSKTLGDRIGEIAFGPLPPEKMDADSLQAPLALPRIYYIPKEKIVAQKEASDAEYQEKIFDLYAFDPAKVPAGTYAILPTDLGTEDAQALKNDTTYTVDMAAVSEAAKDFPTEKVFADPLVLIVHTHGTESFSAEGSVCYAEDLNEPRSTDVSKNIVAVGKVLADALNQKGIPTLHCETMHDKESYIAAYERSAESIANYLEKYPSIRYVFDVHRDSLIRTDRTKLRPVTLRDGEPCAQLMMIIGSDEKGAGEYNWQGNLVLAEAIQQNLIADTYKIARPLYLRGASYNQQQAAHGLLLEIGSCGNRLPEAKNAALAFAEAFANVIQEP